MYSFHAVHGDHVRLTDQRLTAERDGGLSDNLVFSGSPLKVGQPFEIEVIEGSWDMAIGVTARNPEFLTDRPMSLLDLPDSCVMEGGNIYKNGVQQPGYLPKTTCQPSDRICIILTKNGDVHVHVNGVEYCSLAAGFVAPTWAAVELGEVGKITIATQGQSIFRTIWNKMKPKRKQKARTSIEFEDGTTIVKSGPRPVPPANVTKVEISCPYWNMCSNYIETLNVCGAYFDKNYDMCYCQGCVSSRQDEPYYARGEPPATYALPFGWARMGLRTPPQADALKSFQKWHVAFHGTAPANIESILHSKELLMPGDISVAGVNVTQPSGHFTEDNKPDGFDINKIFLSPAIKYAGQPVFARPVSWSDRKTKRKYEVKVALAVRIKPGSYSVGGETLNLGEEIVDPVFKNEEIEWSTKIRGCTILTGILVHVE